MTKSVIKACHYYSVKEVFDTSIVMVLKTVFFALVAKNGNCFWLYSNATYLKEYLNMIYI